MSTRAERKAAAQAQRHEWRISWVEMCRAHISIGGTMADALNQVSRDADQIGVANPQIKSEVLRAIIEFAEAMRRSIEAVK